mmetsp:Transcript_34183/g.80985  ORF Transcript_34183/g.80985 Transcript_34183/m.80985 type:complete len:283 (+) Transcript_34183:2-850(+)
MDRALAALCVAAMAVCAAGSHPGATSALLRAAGPEGAGSAPRDSLRLRGGGPCTGCRGTRQQSKVTVVRYTDPRIMHEPNCFTKRPGSGPKMLTKLDRHHGMDVIRAALWDASPRAPKFSPMTAAVRMGSFRQNKFQTNKPLKEHQPPDVSLGLLKIAHRGQAHLIPAYLEAGADINYMAKEKTGAPMHLIGLTPLSAAAHQGHIDAVHMLLSKGADVQCGSLRDPSGKGALWLEIVHQQAAMNRQTEKDFMAKVRPIVGANRRTPGVRKTRHAKGARGGRR